MTTDYASPGMSWNYLEQLGRAVDMDATVLGKVSAELADPLRSAIVCSISDPRINGDPSDRPRLTSMQTHRAVWYDEVYGSWTGVSGALATSVILARTAEGVAP